MRQKDHPIYSNWVSMRRRCLDKKYKCYKDYGGRGITICERWNNFWLFVEDMGEKPKLYEIDRINNEGIYEPNNCRWVDKATNTRKTRRSIIVEYKGRKLYLREDLCKNLSPKNYAVICRRIYGHGWEVERAVDTPIKKQDSSLPLGVSYDLESGKYIAQIIINKKRKYIGRYQTYKEASNAYTEVRNSIRS